MSKTYQAIGSHARDNVAETTDDGPAEAIIEIWRIGLTSADMPIPEMVGAVTINPWLCRHTRSYVEFYPI
jgi:hypothetical protein